MPAPSASCEHCGRRDVGSKRAGRALVKVPVRDPVTNLVVGERLAAVCCPTVAFRPKCDTLITLFGHTVDCDPCLTYNPPGAEDGYRARLVGQGGNTPATRTGPGGVRL